MIVYFDEGINRIWYRPVNFQIGLDVQLRLWDPDLSKKNLQKFTEFEEGLYYLDYNFDQRGTWMGIIYENEIKITANTFSVGMRQPGIVRYIKKE